MSNVSQKQHGVNRWIAGILGLVYIHRRPEANEPIATPLADFLVASYRNGQTDAAGVDASEMTFADWQEIHGTNGATVTVEPKAIYFEEVVT